MEIIEAVKNALPVFAGHKDSDWEQLEAALIGAGIPARLAGKLLEFMPLAFGRVFLDGMGVQFEDYYVRYDAETRRKRENKLADEPVYAESLWAAKEIIARQAAGEAFTAVALRSAEVAAVNDALHANSKPENLVMAPPYLPWDDEEASEQPLPPKKKWQFWK